MEAISDDNGWEVDCCMSRRRILFVSAALWLCVFQAFRPSCDCCSELTVDPAVITTLYFREAAAELCSATVDFAAIPIRSFS